MTFRRPLVFLTVALTIAATAPAHATGIKLLKDINPGSVEQGASSNPQVMAEAGGIVYFTADDGVHGRELWRIDPVSGEHAMVKDIFPGESGSDPYALMVHAGVVFFAANDGVHGAELWRTDGTVQGTVLVADFRPGAGSAIGSPLFTLPDDVLLLFAFDGDGYGLWRIPVDTSGIELVAVLPDSVADIAVAGASLYFRVRPSDGGPQLWVSDGTAAGTLQLGAFQGSVLQAFQPTAIGDGILFVADDGLHGRELWRSDGTVAGTMMLSDIVPGPEASYPNLVGASGSKAWFTAWDGSTGNLWVTDGTAAGTELIGPSLDSVLHFVPIDGGALFVASDVPSGSELWRSDGTPSGTFRLKDIMPGPAGSSPSNFLRAPDGVYFSADDGVHGFEVWKSDGTSDGTTMLTDVVPQSWDRPMPNFVREDTLYFQFGTNEFWKTDGTVAGTERLYTIQPRSMMVDAGGTLVFGAFDGTQTELWQSDGTPTGTRLLADIAGGEYGLSSGAGPFIVAGAELLFAADELEYGREVWRSDGSSNGTAVLKDIAPGAAWSYAQNLTVVGTRLFFTAQAPVDGEQLWVSDGTAAGTLLVSPGGPTVPRDLTAVGGTLFFVGYTPAMGGELWKSDGTAGGTTLVKELVPGPSSAPTPPFELTAVGGTLFFLANDGATGIELWKSDGTAAGTVVVKDIAPGSLSGADSLSSAGGMLFFRGNDLGPAGLELWKSDGTAAGTVMVKDIEPGAGSALPRALTEIGGALYFIAYDDQLWRSDGTSAGTVMVRDFDAPVRDLKDVDGEAYFFVRGGTQPGLWKTDGSPAGTAHLSPVLPSFEESYGTAVSGVLYFAGRDAAHGDELWRSDGTPGGTAMIEDLVPGSNDSYPQHLTAIGETLVFSAASRVSGYEPMMFLAGCGNGAIDFGEACDDGNQTDGDGCDAGCVVTECGNGIRTGGEACDDGNLLAGDCCSPTCAFEAAGAPCAADDFLCTDDVCDGAGGCNPLSASGTPCRALRGECDVADACDGLNPFCPANQRLTTQCRAAVSSCDAAEHCSGSSDACPADRQQSAGTPCADDGQLCTADVCDGSGSCSHPAGNAGALCRPAAGDCDAAEICTGSEAVCPPDAMLPSASVCRPATGVCDVAESCTGASVICPGDAHLPDGSPCADTDVCTLAVQCVGGACQATASLDCDDGDLCTQDSCAPNTGCVNEGRPANTCRPAAKSMLTMLRKPDDPAKSRLLWKWIKGAATTSGELGDPTAGTPYGLCVYDGGEQLIAAVSVAPGASTWSAVGSGGFKFNDPSLTQDGVRTILVKGGVEGRAKAIVKGKGAALPNLPLGALSLPLRVQMTTGEVCLETTFGSADVVRSDQQGFKAKR